MVILFVKNLDIFYWSDFYKLEKWTLRVTKARLEHSIKNSNLDTSITKTENQPHTLRRRQQLIQDDHRPEDIETPEVEHQVIINEERVHEEVDNKDIENKEIKNENINNKKITNKEIKNEDINNEEIQNKQVNLE